MGNRISETGRIGTDKVELTYEYTVENRLVAVYEAGDLLVAAAYDGDGNRVFQINYNLDTDEEWKCHYGSGCDKNHDGDGCGSDKNGNDKDDREPQGSKDNGCADNDKDGKEKIADNKDSASKSTYTYCLTEKAEEKEDAYRCGIHFPVNAKVSQTERELISKVKNCGKQNYELIEYINDVNREYTEVLVEQNIFGKTDTSYVYGVDRLSLDRYNGCSGYYLYDPRGSITGITNERGQLYQSYRYDANGGITYGAPQYENEYTYNGESYNPNIESQYLRARYYDVVTANFLTEDTYLGNIIEPLTLNRYNYCSSSPLNYVDPSGNALETVADVASLGMSVYDFKNDPSFINGLMVAWDAAAIVIPFIPASYALKIVTKLDNIIKPIEKVVKYTDDAVVLAKRYADELVNYLTKNADVYFDLVKKYADEAGALIKQYADKADSLVKKADNWLDEQLSKGWKYISEQAEKAKLYITKNACDMMDDAPKVDLPNDVTPDLNKVPDGSNTSPGGNGGGDKKPDGKDNNSSEPKSGVKTNYENETPRSGEEWEAFFKDKYGSENVVWDSKSGSNSEVFYRTMSQADYDYLRMTGELPATSETFISPTYSFSSNYDGVTVEFELRNGTTNSLLEIGVGNNADQAIRDYGVLPQVSKGWTENNAFFKGEGTQTNIGLGQGKALEIFNSNIINFTQAGGK